MVQHHLQNLLLLGLQLYRGLFSPVLAALLGPLGFGCRFTPTCSRYASDAVQTHGPIAGSWLAAKRLCRCHPWGKCGHDPVSSAPPRPLSPTLTSCRNGS